MRNRHELLPGLKVPRARKFLKLRLGFGPWGCLDSALCSEGFPLIRGSCSLWDIDLDVMSACAGAWVVYAPVIGKCLA